MSALPDDHIEVMYTCQLCGDKKVKVRTKKRQRDQSTEDYMNQAMEDCTEMHTLRNPLCRTRHLDLMIPMPEKLEAPLGSGMHKGPLTEAEKQALRDMGLKEATGDE